MIKLFLNEYTQITIIIIIISRLSKNGEQASQFEQIFNQYRDLHAKVMAHKHYTIKMVSSNVLSFIHEAKDGIIQLFFSMYTVYNTSVLQTKSL